MKNIQVIDGADNCTYDIFSLEDADFHKLFPNETDIQFYSDLLEIVSQKDLDAIFTKMWLRRIPKSEVCGIHGTLFYELDHKKQYYPTKIDEEIIRLI